MCSSSQVNLEDALLGSPGNSVVPKNKITVSVLMDYVQFSSQLENRMNVCDVFIQPGEFRGHFPWFSMKFSSTKKQNHCQCSDGLHTVHGSHGKSYEHICDVHPAMKLSEACIWIQTFSKRLNVYFFSQTVSVRTDLSALASWYPVFHWALHLCASFDESVAWPDVKVTGLSERSAGCRTPYVIQLS